MLRLLEVKVRLPSGAVVVRGRWECGVKLKWVGICGEGNVDGEGELVAENG